MKKTRTATLVMQPNVPPMTWEEFCNKTKPYSVAIDGFVKTGPRFQNRSQGGPRANLNHHEEVDRFSTRATCAQALLDIRTGLFDTFRTKKGDPRVIVYANDCDQDVCTTWFLFKYGWMTKQILNPLLNKLVYMEDMLDTTAGAYPFPKDMPILRELAWIFEPYTEFRLAGGLKTHRTSKAFKEIVELVERRIMLYLTGRGKSVPIDTRYQVIGGGPGWTMVKEIGAQARTGMLSDGIKTFLSIREEGGTISFSVGRMSNKVPGDILGFLNECTRAEIDPRKIHGGSNTIGGSNRDHGTGLRIETLVDFMNKHVKAV